VPARLIEARWFLAKQTGGIPLCSNICSTTIDGKSTSKCEAGSISHCVYGPSVCFGPSEARQLTKRGDKNGKGR
jgi:hypothetical protein